MYEQIQAVVEERDLPKEIHLRTRVVTQMKQQGFRVKQFVLVELKHLVVLHRLLRKEVAQ